jgi:hypothetical protein
VANWLAQPSRQNCIIKLILRKLPPRNLSSPLSVPSWQPVTPGKAPVLLPRQRALPPAKQRLDHKAAQFFKHQKMSLSYFGKY